MNRRTWLWAALVAGPAVVIGGMAYAKARRVGGHTCPLTGETLLCPDCCPPNARPARAEAGYTCPLTCERLPCPRCCPLTAAE